MRINFTEATIIWQLVSLSDNKTNIKPPFSLMKEELTQFFAGPSGACEVYEICKQAR